MMTGKTYQTKNPMDRTMQGFDSILSSLQNTITNADRAIAAEYTPASSTLDSIDICSSGMERELSGDEIPLFSDPTSFIRFVSSYNLVNNRSIQYLEIGSTHRLLSISIFRASAVLRRRPPEASSLHALAL